MQQDYEALCLGTYLLRDEWIACLDRNCAGVLRQHLSRRRTCFLPDRDHIIVNQFRCNGCGTFVTFLPPFAAPGKLYPAGTIRAAVEARREGIATERIRLDPSHPHRLPDPRTIRRWQLEFSSGDALPLIPVVGIVAGERREGACRSPKTRGPHNRNDSVPSRGAGAGSIAGSSSRGSSPP